jgi:hypothetical protein
VAQAAQVAQAAAQAVAQAAQAVAQAAQVVAQAAQVVAQVAAQVVAQDLHQLPDLKWYFKTMEGELGLLMSRFLLLLSLSSQLQYRVHEHLMIVISQLNLLIGQEPPSPRLPDDGGFVPQENGVWRLGMQHVAA